MDALENYLNYLIDITFNEEQLKNVDRDEILDKLQHRIEYEMESQEEWWQDKIKEML